jgi:hypothetical protein
MYLPIETPTVKLPELYLEALRLQLQLFKEFAARLDIQIAKTNGTVFSFLQLPLPNYPFVATVLYPLSKNDQNEEQLCMDHCPISVSLSSSSFFFHTLLSQCQSDETFIFVAC